MAHKAAKVEAFTLRTQRLRPAALIKEVNKRLAGLIAMTVEGDENRSEVAAEMTEIAEAAMRWLNSCWIVGVEQNKDHDVVHECLSFTWDVLGQLDRIDSCAGPWKRFPYAHPDLVDSYGNVLLALKDEKLTGASLPGIVLWVWRDVLLRVVQPLKARDDVWAAVYKISGQFGGKCLTPQLLDGGEDVMNLKMRDVRRPAHWDPGMQETHIRLEKMFSDEWEDKLQGDEFLENPTLERYKHLIGQQPDLKLSLLSYIRTMATKEGQAGLSPSFINGCFDILVEVKDRERVAELLFVHRLILANLKAYLQAISLISAPGTFGGASREFMLRSLREWRNHVLRELFRALPGLREGGEQLGEFFTADVVRATRYRHEHGAYGNDYTRPAFQSVVHKWGETFLRRNYMADETHLFKDYSWLYGEESQKPLPAFLASFGIEETPFVMDAMKATVKSDMRQRHKVFKMWEVFRKETAEYVPWLEMYKTPAGPAVYLAIKEKLQNYTKLRRSAQPSQRGRQAIGDSDSESDSSQSTSWVDDPAGPYTGDASALYKGIKGIWAVVACAIVVPSPSMTSIPARTRPAEEDDDSMSDASLTRPRKKTSGRAKAKGKTKAKGKAKATATAPPGIPGSATTKSKSSVNSKGKGKAPVVDPTPSTQLPGPGPPVSLGLELDDSDSDLSSISSTESMYSAPGNPATGGAPRVTWVPGHLHNDVRTLEEIARAAGLVVAQGDSDEDKDMPDAAALETATTEAGASDLRPPPGGNENENSQLGLPDYTPTNPYSNPPPGAGGNGNEDGQLLRTLSARNASSNPLAELAGNANERGPYSQGWKKKIKRYNRK